MQGAVQQPAVRGPSPCLCVAACWHQPAPSSGGGGRCRREPAHQRRWEARCWLGRAGLGGWVVKGWARWLVFGMAAEEARRDEAGQWCR